MKKNSVITRIGLLALMLWSINAYAAAVDLGTAASFGVLGASAVTNTGSTTIDGDLGIWPNGAGSITGFPPGSYTGMLHAGDAAAQQAQSDAVAAYSSLTNMPVTVDLTSQDLGGLTLTPGVYNFSTSAQLTGTLNLDGPGEYVFLIGSTLTTASNAEVLASSGANVYWAVGSSATLGTDTAFIGNILAVTSITLNGGSLDGRALANNGAVTITAQETIVIPEPVTLVLLLSGAGVLSRRLRIIA